MEEIKRINTKKLYSYNNLTARQRTNSELNIREAETYLTTLASLPRRIVLELTNACNLNCIMCGRSHTNFKPTFFNTGWLEYLTPFMESAEEITLMGWGEPTIHPEFEKFLEFSSGFPIKKYILTNGVNLNRISPWIFEYGTDILAVSLDGPDSYTNDSIRLGSDFNSIITDLRQFVVRRLFSSVKPHINTVTTLMKSNIKKFPGMVDLAADLGIEEVKGVFLTAFSKELEAETLYDSPELVRECFQAAKERADKYNILISLPHIPGEDPAGDLPHKHCYLAWRDLFIGSDGFQRVCMSSEIKLNNIITGSDNIVDELWNGKLIKEFRGIVNSDTSVMRPACQRCYQSSCANWNKKYAFIQTDMNFHPDWS